MITGRGGLPEDPRQPLMGQVIWRDDRRVGEMGEVGGVREVEEVIVEAQGWIVDPAGTVTLVARHSQQSTGLRDPLCAMSKSKS